MSLLGSGLRGFSIRASLYAGFGALALLCAGYAIWSVYALKNAEATVRQTYDHSLMAINYARVAEANAVRLLQAQTDQRGELIDVIVSDLDVVADRTADYTREEVDRMRAALTEWKTDGLPQNASVWVDENFDLLTELLASDSFIERESALGAADKSTRFAVIGMGLILAGSAFVAGLLSQILVRPLSNMASTAREISGGHFDAKLPKVIGSEMMALSSSMALMQQNIADRIAREAEGRQWAELRLNEAIQNAADAILILDRSDCIVLGNDAARELLSADELAPGKKLSAVFEKAGIDDAQIEKLLSGDEVQVPSGQWVKAAKQNSGDHGTVIIWSDVSAMKLREQSLEAANEAKTRFIATMSHELRTPLNSIIGFSQLIKDQSFGPIGDENYVEFASEVFKSGDNLLTVINDIIDYSNAQQSTYGTNLRKSDLFELFKSLSEDISGDETFANVELVTDIPSTRQEASIHRAHMTKALRHLLRNAAQFSPPQSVIGLDVTYGEDEFSIVISDQGKGMTHDEMTLALQAFEQSDGSTTRSHEGMGLGLPLAKAIIDGHTGDFHMESEPGKGTTIKLRVPYLPDTDKKHTIGLAA